MTTHGEQNCLSTALLGIVNGVNKIKELIALEVEMMLAGVMAKSDDSMVV